MFEGLHIGTCSWKYPSWRGLVYSDAAQPDYLREYARQFEAVEIDQWFWSLFGPDREGMEKRAGKDWSQLLDPHDADLDALAGVLKQQVARGRKAWVFVNNHFEGCAPRTIDRIKQRMQ